MGKWTEERRRLMADLIRQRQPWNKSTGPKTEEGKKCSSQNAYKHGNRDANMRKLYKLLAEFSAGEKEVQVLIK